MPRRIDATARALTESWIDMTKQAGLIVLSNQDLYKSMTPEAIGALAAKIGAAYADGVLVEYDSRAEKT